jgi:DNA-binding NtrC family response regulator
MPRAGERTILLVDDEAAQRRLNRALLERNGWAVREAADGAEAIAILTGEQGDTLDAVLLDNSMPGKTGLEVLAAVCPARPTLPVIMLTAQSSLATAVEAMRAGASDFLIKPANPERLLLALENALSADEAGGELRPLSEKLDQDLPFEDIVGSAPAFRAALAIAAKAARAHIPVLIEGESGVGKEVIARAVHAASPRARRPLVVVNCGAIPPNLVESVLFGHEKGSFTGAINSHSGRFQEADGGTLFLDEVGELPLDGQVRLLRALQSGEIEPVGSIGPVAVDVRVIAATNRDLAAEVKAGRFRQDLYYRLAVVQVTIPPLRERPGDVSRLTRHLLTRICQQPGMRPLGLTDAALDLLRRYSWPGNVRQLQNALFRAAVLCEGEALVPEDFPQLDEQARAAVLPPAAPYEAGGVTLFGSDGHIRSLDEIEADIIRLAIGHYRGRMSEVARRLQIGRSTLYRKLGELGIDVAA